MEVRRQAAAPRRRPRRRLRRAPRPKTKTALMPARRRLSPTALRSLLAPNGPARDRMSAQRRTRRRFAPSKSHIDALSAALAADQVIAAPRSVLRLARNCCAPALGSLALFAKH